MPFPRLRQRPEQFCSLQLVLLALSILTRGSASFGRRRGGTAYDEEKFYLSDQSGVLIPGEVSLAPAPALPITVSAQ